MISTPSQAFQSQSSSEIVTVPSVHDPKTKKYVVRWRDIQRRFDNAKYIMNGDDMVLFLSNDDLVELVPLRIAYHPDVVLKVVTHNGNHSSGLRGPNTNPLASKLGSYSSNEGDNSSLVLRDLGALEMNSDNHALIMRSYLPPELSAQDNPRMDTDQSDHFDHERLHQSLLEMATTVTIQQEQLRLLTQQNQQLQQQSQDMQRQMNETQHNVQRTDKQSQDMQQQIDEVQHNIQQANKQIRKLNTRGNRFILFSLSLFLFLSFSIFSQHQMHQLINNVAQLPQKQLEHVDRTLQLIQAQRNMHAQDGNDSEASTQHQQINQAAQVVEQIVQQKELFLEVLQEMRQKSQPTQKDHFFRRTLEAGAWTFGLLPLRFAHHPGVVLEVITMNDVQAGSNSTGTSSSSNDSYAGNSQLLPAVTRTETNLIARDVASLRITESHGNRTLAVHPQGLSSESPAQDLPSLDVSHFQTWARTSMDLQEHIRQLQEQMAEVHGNIQQTQEQTQFSRQQIQDQIDRILHDLQQLQQQNANILETAQRSEQERQQLGTLLQDIQHAHQTQDSQQQTQQQIKDVLEKIQKMEKEGHHFMKHVQHLKLQHERSRLQEITLFSDHLTLVQYRVRATLAISYKNLSIPRLFIVLPGPTGFVDAQGKLWLMQFRLYFLCECGSHTMTMENTTLHEVHLADHPGYDVVNSNNFFGQFGSYLLMMMHMVKHGVETSGLLVPPLLGFRHASNVDMDQHHLSFVQQNMDRLVDDTIAHIEEVTSILGRDNNTATHSSLTAPELEQIKSYLGIKDGETLTGGLLPMTTQDRCTWICKEHHNIETVLKQLKSIIDISGGVYNNNEVKVKVTSKTMAKQYYEILVQLSKPKAPNMDFINCLGNLESISLEYGRVSIIAYGIAQGEVRDVSIDVARVSYLTMPELELIRQCRPTLFKIRHAPRTEDEDYLVEIVRNTIELHIGCESTLAIAIINMVKSARERLLQNGGKSTLRTFQVMKDGCIPCDINALNDNEGLVTATMSFTKGSTTLDMESHVKLQKYLADDYSEFIRQYGWSIKTLITQEPFGDSHAELLDSITLERGSKLAIVNLTPGLTSRGLDVMDRIIKRAQSLPLIRLFLDNLCGEDQFDMALRLVERYKDRMIGLRLNCDADEDYLDRKLQALPARDGFPLLEEFVISSSHCKVTRVDKIPSMVSGPLQPLKRLKSFHMLNMVPRLFSYMIKDFDLSALEVLSFKGCVFYGKGDLTMLANRIADNESQSRKFRILDLSGCLITFPEDGLAAYTILRVKAPHVKLVGLEKYSSK
ncbi:hypothetical protein BGX31_001904 [Mortierella sp. GBA43]|nr:hypothetical protein BGX31_001904 [Mortierella sp. GBA43]